MKSIKLFLSMLLLGAGMVGQAQDIRSAYFELADNQPGIQRIELEVNDLLIFLDGEGNLLSIRSLKKTPGQRSADLEFDPNGIPSRNKGMNLDYYGSYDQNKAGKIKAVNGISVDYYSTFDIHDQPGKLKSIGSISFKYTNAFDIHDAAGSLKSVGNIQIRYTNAFDIHDQKGNVKSVGPVTISWYNSMDMDSAKGRIKSIRGNTESISVGKQSGRKRS